MYKFIYKLLNTIIILFKTLYAMVINNRFSLIWKQRIAGKQYHKNKDNYELFIKICSNDLTKHFYCTCSSIYFFKISNCRLGLQKTFILLFFFCFLCRDKIQNVETRTNISDAQSKPIHIDILFIFTVWQSRATA
jgi:hypothetical protein